MLSSRINLGLPSLPSDDLPKPLYPEISTIYKAIKNLLEGVSDLAGIDPPDKSEWADSSPSRTLLTGNLTRLYLVAGVNINAGQVVNIYDSGAGVMKLRLASASSASTMAHGICTETTLAGSIAPMQWLRAYVNSIGGMTPGTLYWLSTVGGAVQNLAPVAVGTIRQPIGVAFAASQMLMDIPLAFFQN